jgi:hypothetical protein
MLPPSNISERVSSCVFGMIAKSGVCCTALLILLGSLGCSSERLPICDVWMEEQALPACVSVTPTVEELEEECEYQVEIDNKCDDQLDLTFYCDPSPGGCPTDRTLDAETVEFVELGSLYGLGHHNRDVAISIETVGASDIEEHPDESVNEDEALQSGVSLELAYDHAENDVGVFCSLTEIAGPRDASVTGALVALFLLFVSAFLTVNLSRQ